MKEKQSKTRERRFLWLLAFLLMIPIGMSAQNITVKGVVTDTYDEPIIGASVVQKGATKNGVITDLDGKFTLTVPTNATLTVSYIGMETQDVKAVAGQVLNIKMLDNAEALGEVVVIGYGGSKARKDLTGSVGSVAGIRLAQVPVASAGEALQGKIAGVQVSTVDGAPGAELNIRIRGGGSSFSGNASKPLYVVDGFITNSIDDIPPTDIQSIDVLKDASLTAIYGAKGGNGVVIVTTKSASAGKIQVEFNTYLQSKYLAGKVELLDTYEFVRYQMDYTIGSNDKINQFRHDFGNPNDMDIYKSAVTHDWQDEVLGGSPLTQMYNATVKGGNETLRFSTSLTHHDEQGLISNSGVRRTSMNTKINVKLSPKLSLLINPRFTYRRDLGAGADGLINVLTYRPTNGLREFMYRADKTVNYDSEKYWLLGDPQKEIDQYYQLKHTTNFINQVSLTWQPIEGLTLRTDLAQSWRFYDKNNFDDYLTKKGIDNNNMAVAEITNERTDKYIWTNTASYDKKLRDKHNISLLIGQEMSSEQTTGTVSAARYFPLGTSPRKAFANMGLGDAFYATSAVSTPTNMLSYFGQASYNYDHKYLVSGTFRADGSTRFAPGKQWGYFPSVSAGWVISEEAFMKDVNWVSMLKLRAAVGLAGNNDIKPDQWRLVYGIVSNGGPSWGEGTSNGEKYYNTEAAYRNEIIMWETTLTRNLALDLGFFDGRLTVTPEVYYNTTKDLLFENLIPSTTGYTKQVQNVGQVSNKGVELTVSGDIIRKKDFLLSANLTMGFNKMKVDKLNGQDKEFWTTSSRWKSSDNDFCLKEGSEVGLIYGYVYDGLYGFDEFIRSGSNYVVKVDTETEKGTLNCNAIYGTAPGRPKFKDMNGDNIIDADDRTVIGNTNPRLQGGFGFSGQIKNFDFNANFVYMLDYDLINATAYELSSAVDAKQTSPKNVLAKFNYDNRWVYHADVYNTNADGSKYIYNLNEPILSNNGHQYLDIYEEVNAGKTLWNPNNIGKKITHSYFIEDGSFLRLQDITIGYTLPKKLTKSWGIERLRVYVTGSNVFCWTNYSGYDPEIDIQSGLTPSVDYNRYPRSHGYLFGLNVSF